MSKTFLITGGNFRNKGAQAMVFAVVQTLKSYHPDCQIWMLHHTDDIYENQGVYNFHILRWRIRDRLRLRLGLLALLIKPSLKENEDQVNKLYKKADRVFDVSGYNLSSQFRFITSSIYLTRLARAKKYNVQLTLLPQSFGPFNHKNIFKRTYLNLAMKYYLKYPIKIFCREKQGYTDLKKYTTDNLSESLDIVLLSEQPARDIIYKKFTESKEENLLKTKSVAIIPNEKLLLWNKQNDIWSLYREIIEKIIKQGYMVYILRHSQEDLEYCKKISALVDNSASIKMLFDDYDCIDLSEIISHRDFVIASRYHSLIHAYKSGVPALVIGWAEKYPELMAHFNQEKYYLDIRGKIETSDLLNKLDALFANKDITTDIIKHKLVQYKNNSTELFKVFT